MEIERVYFLKLYAYKIYTTKQVQTDASNTLMAVARQTHICSEQTIAIEYV